MDQQVKQRWIDALRSGKYGQTKNNLHDNVGFCCLGVLCDITKHETGGEWVYQKTLGIYSFRVNEEYDEGVLPETLYKNQGFLDSNAPIVPVDAPEIKPEHRKKLPDDAIDDGPGWYSLSHLNDAGYTFDEIADLIEKYA